MKKTKMMTILALCLGSSTALADPSQFYAGGSVGKTSAEWKNLSEDLQSFVYILSAAGGSGTSISVTDRGDDSDTGFKLYAGYHFNDVVDFRVGYADLGETTAAAELSGPGLPASLELGLSNSTQAIFFDVLTRFKPVSGLSVFTKLGLAATRSDIDSYGRSNGELASLPLSETDYGFAFVPGVGLAYDFASGLGVTLEYELYANVGKKHSPSFDEEFSVLLGSLPKNDVSLLSAGLYYHF